MFIVEFSFSLPLMPVAFGFVAAEGELCISFLLLFVGSGAVGPVSNVRPFAAGEGDVPYPDLVEQTGRAAARC